MNYGLLSVILLGSVAAQGAELESAKCRVSDFAGRTSVRGRVVEAIDGDTIKLAVGSKSYNVRFLSIDTPETKFQGMSQGYWGERAHERLDGLLPVDTQVTVRFDDEICDRYGRILGYVFKGALTPNRILVTEGLAVTYCIYPNLSHCEDYGRLTERARAADRGFFSDSSVELPYDWRRVESGRPVEKYVGDYRTGRVYMPGQAFRIPVGYRVFFIEESDIRAPFYLANAE